MMLTVDSIVGGNRERDLRTGFTIPFRLNLRGMFQFAAKPKWAIDYLTHEKFRLPQLDTHVDMKSGTTSIGDYFTNMLDQSMNWRDVADMVKLWGAKFCLKGVMSADDARKAVDIGCAGIVVSNHGGRQLDGSPAPSISSRKSSTPLATRSTSCSMAACNAAPMCSRRSHWAPRRWASAGSTFSPWLPPANLASSARFR